MIRLRHLGEVNPATPEFERLEDDALVPFVPLEAVWPEGLDSSRRKTEGEASTGYTRFLEGDIVVPKITPTFQANRTTIASGIEGGVAAGTTEIHVVRPRPDVNRRYIRYLLASRPFLYGGEAEMVGVAGQGRVPDDWIRDTETAHIDALIAKKRRLIDLLDDRRAAITVAGVEGGFTSDRFVDSNLPWLRSRAEGWSEPKISMVAVQGTGHTPSRDHPEWWVDCTVPWITTGEVVQFRSDRIVHAVWLRLDRVHGAIDQLNRQIDLLIEHRQALITAAVTGELEIPGVAA